MTRLKNAIVQTVTLFGSLGTLICCALPAMLVSIGAGAAVASLVTAVPQLIWISEHKVAVFIFAGVMLLLSGITAQVNRRAPCPVDPAQAKSCRRVRRWSAAIFGASAILYAIGFYFAFLGAPS
ncbi:MAG: hypothetical protein QOG48_1535 [Verrucomicrobiota bacterium]|jgi:hypothetical protein